MTDKRNKCGYIWINIEEKKGSEVREGEHFTPICHPDTADARVEKMTKPYIKLTLCVCMCVCRWGICSMWMSMTLCKGVYLPDDSSVPAAMWTTGCWQAAAVSWSCWGLSGRLGQKWSCLLPSLSPCGLACWLNIKPSYSKTSYYPSALTQAWYLADTCDEFALEPNCLCI